MHRHVWKIIERENKPPRWPPSGLTRVAEADVPAYLLEGSLVVTFECEKCGTQKVEVKRT